ncbi:MAG: hypothetical protein NTZ05_08350, partial [Chloroflexi bacterium]|nr:hypothetical protein [Chloroflexota bacterium]
MKGGAIVAWKPQTWQQLYQLLRMKHGIDELPKEALRSLAEDGDGAAFLAGWLQYLDHPARYLAEYKNRYIAITPDGSVAAVATNAVALYELISMEPSDTTTGPSDTGLRAGRRIFVTLVKD